MEDWRCLWKTKSGTVRDGSLRLREAGVRAENEKSWMARSDPK